MPPQKDESDACNDKPSANESATNAGGSYWEAPATEASLVGKTLSTLDMTTLESNHPDQQKEKKDDYWEATPETSLQGKTLSTLDMTLMGSPAVIPQSPPKAKTPVITAEEPDDADNAAPSYWDAPQEDTALAGKTLSTLDMMALESNHPDQHKQKSADYWGEATPDKSLEGKTLSTLDMTTLESNHPEEKAQLKKNHSYWEDAAVEESLKGKTLSTLSMSALTSNNPDAKKEKTDSYWEAPTEGKLEGKTLSTIDMVTLETSQTGSVATSATSDSTEGPASYWDEAPIDKSLQGKRLSSISISAMDKQRVDEASPPPANTPYWDWNFKAIKKTLSKMSLSNLRKGSTSDVVLDDDDCVHGGSNGGPTPRSSNRSSTNSLDDSQGSRSKPVKPITQKTHKLRDSWRKSFQRLSTNTLDQLDESTGSGPRLMGRRMFKSRNSLDISSGSRGSQMSIGEDAIMF